MIEDDIDFDVVATVFYEALFREAPETRTLFKNDDQQFLMFVNALQSISDLQDRQRSLNDFLAMLGEKHKDIGLTNEQMNAGRKAFAKALDAGCGDISSEQRAMHERSFSQLLDTMGFTG
ncbi:MAG: hypothetical protein JJ900_03065 [Rhodospirillales bacterium]|nr:hypothetical protein [Rhodospirillales bacterium]MBO6785804.1 hypothetical protein [Rhodospirillales bacterium]